MEEIDEWYRTIESRLNSAANRNSLIVLRIAGIFSIFGAVYIIQDIAKDAARRKRTKNRIMLYMSICDFLNAFVITVIGPAMVPKGIGVPGAVGNQLTCDLQGFVGYVTGGGSAFYNVSLALCYLLMVRYEYSDERLRKLEPYFLYLPPILWLMPAITGLPLGIYNFNENNTCFIAASPIDCDTPESPIECERGELFMYWIYVNTITIGVSACVIITCMVKMYTAVLQRERSGDRFRFRIMSRSSFIGNIATTPISAISPRSSSIPHRDLSSAMRSQGLWYSGAFLFTFSPTFLYYLWQSQSIRSLTLLPFRLLGFANAVIYVRPKFHKFRRDYRSIGVALSIWYTLTRRRPTLEDMMDISEPMNASSYPRAALDCLFSGIKSLIVALKSVMGFSGERHNSNIVTSTEKVVMTSCQEGKGVGGENLSVSIECEKCNQEQAVCQDHTEKEEIVVELETNDGTGVQYQSLGNNNIEVGSEDLRLENSKDEDEVEPGLRNEQRSPSIFICSSKS
jgi:hypothetical protein